MNPTMGGTAALTGALGENARLRTVLDRLVAMSERDYYNPYRLFQWPESIDQGRFWMPPELLTVHGTEVGSELTEGQLQQLSKWESVNFYSLNVHGIRELLTEIVARIHSPGYEITSEYLHHIIGEENEHMWFFATFCLKYAGKIYPNAAMAFAGPEIPEADTFLVFSRLLLFEELVDVFNQQMGTDGRLDPTIQKINSVHHQDESRHIAFGRQMVELLHAELRRTLPVDQLEALAAYLKRFMRSSAESLCSPAAFRDAGIEKPYEARRRVLADPAFGQYVARAFRRSTTFMLSAGIIPDELIPAL
jgi:hypothetical protein